MEKKIQGKNERFGLLKKFEVSENLDMKKLIFKKRQTQIEARKFYERGEQLKKLKGVQTKKIVEKKRGNLEDFMKSTTSKIKRIKRRTLQIIKLDKYHIRDCLKALQAFHLNKLESTEDTTEGSEEKEKAQKEQDDLIYVQITVSKKMHQITLKPIPL
jgi:hypothetical protein